MRSYAEKRNVKIARVVKRNCSNSCANLNTSIRKKSRGRGKPHLRCGSGGRRAEPGDNILQLASVDSTGKVVCSRGFVNGRCGVLPPHSRRGWNRTMPEGVGEKLKELSLGTLCNHCLPSVSSKSGCSELVTWSALCFHFVYCCYFFFFKWRLLPVVQQNLSQVFFPLTSISMLLMRVGLRARRGFLSFAFIDFSTAFPPIYWLKGLKMKWKVTGTSGSGVAQGWRPHDVSIGMTNENFKSSRASKDLNVWWASQSVCLIKCCRFCSHS